jgi:hypothetical protein
VRVDYLERRRSRVDGGGIGFEHLQTMDQGLLNVYVERRGNARTGIETQAPWRPVFWPAYLCDEQQHDLLIVGTVSSDGRDSSGIADTHCDVHTCMRYATDATEVSLETLYRHRAI